MKVGGVLMYEQDYIMRIIQNFIKFLSIIIFGKDTFTYELYEDEENEQNDILHKKLVELISQGEINEAENILFEKFNPKNKRQMMVAIDFYQRLNDLDDTFLQDNNFSRVEIEEGLKDIAKKYGIVTS